MSRWGSIGSPPDEILLSDYGRRFRRYALVLALAGGAGAAVGVVAVALTPTTSRATVSVLVSDATVSLPSPASDGPKQITLDTEAQRATSAPVLAAVREATGDPTPAAHLSISAVPVTKIMRITYQAPDANGARSGADAAAAAFLADREQALVDRRERQLEALQTSMGSLQDELNSLLGDTPDNAGLAVSRQQVVEAAMQQRAARIRSVLSTPTEPGVVVRRSKSGSARHNPTVPPASGFVLGVALAGAFLAIRRPRTETAGDALSLLPGCAVVELELASDYRGLDGLVRGLLSAGTGEARSVLVLPVSDAVVTPAGSVARGLAAALTLTDSDAILVSFGRGDAPPARGKPQMSVLGTRTYVEVEMPAPRDRSDLVGGWLAHHVGTVVIDGPAANTAEATLLASVCHGVVLVVTSKQDERHLRIAASRVVRAGGKVEGVVVLRNTSSGAVPARLPVGVT